MSIDIVRAWKDEQYRMSLTEAERASIPANPAGMVELDESDLEGVAGGNADGTSVFNSSCCSTVATACCKGESLEQA